MTSIRKRKTRSQRQGEKFNVGGDWSKESEIQVQTKEVVVDSSSELSEQKTIPKADIDQIRAEIFEDRYTTLTEPEYMDESHNWDSDNELESEEYWHFVGRYE